MKKTWLYVVVFIALLSIRFWISTLSFNNDMLSFQAWVKSIRSAGFEGFYSRDVSPWANPNYPPVITASFYYLDNLGHDLNLTDYKINFALYKLPAVAIETAAITIFLIVFGPFCALIAAVNPGIIYNTLLWGQTEGLVAALVAICLYLFYKKRPFWAMIVFAFALLTKQSSIIFAPLVLIILFKNFSFKKTLLPIVVSAFLTIAAFIPFAGKNFMSFAFTFYLNASSGQPHQWQASVNALNLWFLAGLNLVKDSQTFLSLSYRSISIIITALFFILIICLFYRRKYSFESSLLAAGLINFASCMFLTRVHERHLLPTLLLLAPIAVKSALGLTSYAAISFIYFTNLYLIWNAKFYPFNQTQLKILSFVNILVFFYFLFLLFKENRNKKAI